MVAVRAATIGLAAGIVGGLLGVGGGIVIVPALVIWLAVSQHAAHATSVAAIVVIAGAAVVPFAAAGNVDWGAAGALFVGAGFGAFAGARLIGHIPEDWLRRGFVALLLVSAVRFAL